MLSEWKFSIIHIIYGAFLGFLFFLFLSPDSSGIKFGIIFIAMLAFIASYPLLIFLRIYTKVHIPFGYWLKNGYLYLFITLILTWTILYNLIPSS